MDSLIRRISTKKLDVQGWRNRSEANMNNNNNNNNGNSNGTDSLYTKLTRPETPKQEKRESRESRDSQTSDGVYTVLKRSEETKAPVIDVDDDNDSDEEFASSRRKAVISNSLEGKSEEELLKLWLGELQLEFLAQVFISNNMSFANLKSVGLSDDDLDELGIKKELYRSKLLRHAKKLKRNNGQFSIKEKDTDTISVLELTLTNVVSRDDSKKKKDSDELSASKLSSPSFMFAEGKWKGYNVRIVRMNLHHGGEVFDKELSSIRKFSAHPNLVKLHGILSGNDNLSKRKNQPGPAAQYLVWEQCDSEDLETAITRMKRDRKDNYIFGDRRGAVKVLLSIAHGMYHLHSKAIVHGNLNPSNVFVQFDYSAKLTDYGIHKFVHSTKVSKKRDILNFGMIMWKLYNEKELPKTLDDHADEKFPKKIRNVFHGCIAENPNDRLSFQEIVLRLSNYYNSLKSVKTMKVGEADTSAVSYLLEAQAKEKDQIITGLTGQMDSKDAEIARLKAELAKYQSPEKRVVEGFGAERTLGWEEFVHIFLSNFVKATVDTVNKLKTILVSNGVVERKSWCDFADWFAPYSHSFADVHMEDVADIVGSEWFYGFITPTSAEELLMNKSEGTYLIRFSTNPGCFALSVNYGRVGHWRIVVEELNSEHPILKIDERLYKSVGHIIEIHKTGGEPLEIKRPTLRHCWLTKPANKFDSGKDDIYYGNPLAD